jgi:glutamate synthase domain-containing protein 2/glutamate synthase domain-containing protein 1/glutamate synthase domain-containing protein 3
MMHLQPSVPRGLYDPQFEHDACGVGFVAHINGAKTHDIIEKGLQVLLNLAHRGACGCDATTGDGAGILIQLPHEFMRTAATAAGIFLPAAGEYGTGLIFLPREAQTRRQCEEIIERIIRQEHQLFLGWRDVSVDSSALGDLARKSEPVIRQVFIARGPDMEDALQFERKLFVIRKRAEKAIRESGTLANSKFYIPSLSHRTFIYKGLLLAHQLPAYFTDLANPSMASGLALVHQRFSTNTFPTWELAQPFRFLGHNGEINTLRGNLNWMKAREACFLSSDLGADITKVLPVVSPGGSDSACLDNVVEMLLLSGRSLPHVMMMMIPEAWQNDSNMDPDKRGFYEYHAGMLEPWDGPAAISFTDGRLIGATQDRNGLRPARYVVTHDGLVVLASEVGVLDFPPENIAAKGRLQPGKMFLVDTGEGRIISDDEIKHTIATQRPYRQWVEQGRIELHEVPEPLTVYQTNFETLVIRQQVFAYTQEDMKVLIGPMATTGQEPVGSMGNDTPLAVLSDRPQLLYNYFKQLFAQVTNPPIDSIREELVMSLVDYIGRVGNLLEETPERSHQLKIPHPILSNREVQRLRYIARGDFKSITFPMLYRVADGEAGLRAALDDLCKRACRAIINHYSVIILSDRGVSADLAPIPALLAVSAVHHHLIREGLRSQVALTLESGEAREVMHFALLIGYGASAINPYLALETLEDMVQRGVLPPEITKAAAEKNYIKAINKGLLKIFSKMGISTLRSYRGAQIFEAIGLSKALVDEYFTDTPSRIGGIGLDVIAEEVACRHRHAFSNVQLNARELDPGGQYQWRRRGEYHLFNPETIATLQQAVRSNNFDLFKRYSGKVDDQSRNLCTLRSLFDLKPIGPPVPLEEVEPISEICKRFATGAMSFGSISKEAHETLAIAMNTIGGRSNSGEGGEDPVRYTPGPDGINRNSKIKQVASARFGVTSAYLVSAEDMQIKIAQGAKPGEGGQLPGHKVDEVIARVRYSTPGVTLISPPPHHDIYSIEDLAQLIYDLKNVNPRARVSVKLVSEVGVGTVAAGVAKAHADMILIAGHDGGTGASPVSSIKHAGAPWELGLAETQQTLVENNLRGRVRLQADGQMKTGRDVIVAALLGAEEFGFATAALVAEGCVMMRKCHLNTCPVGVATQDPELRKRFNGKPEHVVRFFQFLAEEVRQFLASLGFRKLDEAVGRVECLDLKPAISHWKARGLDLSPILRRPRAGEEIPIRCVEEQDHGLAGALDYELIGMATEAIETAKPLRIVLPVRNIHRTVGTMLGGQISRRYGDAGLPDDTIEIKLIGSAGQSLGAWLPRGVTIILEGDSNDYVGKGLCGGRIIVHPPKQAGFVAHENIIIGNVVLYGATGGELFAAGMAGERFAVRNSGAIAVVEGVGDHGCEYMTGGRVVVLGTTGRNFAAGMSGGIAYVLDEQGTFKRRCNLDMVELQTVADAEEQQWLRERIELHQKRTGSLQAARILAHWSEKLPQFVKVMPLDYKRVLEQRRQTTALDSAVEAEKPMASAAVGKDEKHHG